MGWIIGHGNSFIFRQGGGTSWQTYWKNRYISALSVITTGSTTQTVTATIVGTGYNGVSYEYSTDGITYVEHGTSANGSYLATGLTEGTLYYWRARLYKGSSYGIYSQVCSDYAGLWYLAGGVAPSAIVGAYKFVGRDLTEVNSLKNIASPGTNDLTKTGSPLWNNTNGWGGFSINNFLDGPLYKTKTYSFLISFKEALTPVYGRVFSAENDTTGQHGSYYIPAYGAKAYIMQADDYNEVTQKSHGVGGANQSNMFLDGEDVENVTPAGLEYNIACRIGYCSANGGVNFVFTGRVTGLVIFNTSITDAQMIAVSNRMKEERFIYNGLFDYSKLVRYAGNPIIMHNTEAWNTYAVDTPYVRSEQKIGDTYYIITQACATVGAWDKLVSYSSTDLIHWTTHGIVLTVPSGGWDEAYIVHPTIIKINDTYFMYYSAYESGVPKIGLATSPDMLNWTRYGDSPVFSLVDGNTYSPCVIKIDDTYYMYFADTTAHKKIRYAISSDGYTWTLAGIALESPFISDHDNISVQSRYMDPWVIKNKYGFYEMFYSSVKSDVPMDQKISYAFSFDGINWFKHQGFILSAIGAGWESSYLGDPCMLELESGERYFFYVGISGVWPGDSFDAGVAILE